MKFSVLLVLLYWTFIAFAGSWSGTFERMMIWYAYQIELLSTAPRTIATGCPTPCNFGRFMEYIDDWQGAPAQWLADPDNILPDLYDTANSIRSWIPPEFRHVDRILATVDGRHDRLMEKISQIISSIDPVTRLNNAELFKAALLATQTAADIRYVEWSRNFVPLFENQSKLNAVQVQTPTNQGMAYDRDATLRDPYNKLQWASAADLAKAVDYYVDEVHFEQRTTYEHWGVYRILRDGAEAQKMCSL